mmetsp:Transcript_414/g.1171  ORF Transcript_414/g.1171 Transcript_414/m.1171 type:complete len:216 (-) Transcript_414:238-885(-)
MKKRVSVLGSERTTLCGLGEESLQILLGESSCLVKLSPLGQTTLEAVLNRLLAALLLKTCLFQTSLLRLFFGLSQFLIGLGSETSTTFVRSFAYRGRRRLGSRWCLLAALAALTPRTLLLLLRLARCRVSRHRSMEVVRRGRRRRRGRPAAASLVTSLAASLPTARATRCGFRVARAGISAASASSTAAATTASPASTTATTAASTSTSTSTAGG